MDIFPSRTKNPGFFVPLGILSTPENKKINVVRGGWVRGVNWGEGGYQQQLRMTAAKKCFYR